MVGLLVAAALAAATPAVAEARQEAAPAIFVVGDADTTVYLFGTFHALDGKSDWFNNRIRNAFDQSNELVLETVIPEPVFPQIISQPAPAQLRTLSVTPSASFLASTRMAISAGRSKGLQVDNGADMVLRRAAEADGKNVEGLETLQSQLNLFTRMPAARAAPAPGGPKAMNSLSDSMLEMQEAWKQGDQAIFVRMLGQLERGSPDTYRMMFTERNERWADWIRARLQTPGTVFVAVGAGHLAGKDSVLVKLAERGIPSARVN